MGGLGVFIGMIIYSFFDGVFIVVGFEVSSELGFFVFVVVLFYKILDGLIIFLIVFVVFNDRKKVFIVFVVLVLVIIFGGVLVWLFSDIEFVVEVFGDFFVRIVLFFLVGVFLYVVVMDLFLVVN